MNSKKGFTLLELLIVVAMVGMLTAIVLGLLNTARKRGDDASVKTNTHTVSTQAEIFYLDNGSSYLPAGGSTFGIASCPTYNASGTNMLSKNKFIADAIALSVGRSNGLNSCYNSANTWAVAIGLKEKPNTSWCVDTSGSARIVNSDPSSAINVSTYGCN